MQAQRNKMLNDLDNEYFDFIRYRISALQSGFSNYDAPTGKELKQDQKYGKALVKILHLWTQLKELELKKQEAEKSKEILLFTHSQVQKKPDQSWSKHHKKQLDIGLQYIKLKKQIEKM